LGATSSYFINGSRHQGAYDIAAFFAAASARANLDGHRH
jgi:hypothetical protein